MRKILIVISLIIIASIINACCSEYRYKSMLSTLEFIESSGVTSANGTWVLVNFRVVDEFTKISLGSFISQSKADGTICKDQTIYEAYEDPIESMSIRCDKDLLSKKANEDLSGTSFGYYITNNASGRKAFALIKDDLNDVFKPSTHPGRDLWLEVPASDFLETGNYKFTLRLELKTGRVVETSSSDIYIVR